VASWWHVLHADPKAPRHISHRSRAYLVSDDARPHRMRLAASGELRERLATALDGLVVEQRDVLRLRVVEGRPYSEVARELGISEQTARARTSRALRALRESAALRDLMEASENA
jgi:RNA polymerase sigma factor (sigma-70 family)